LNASELSPTIGVEIIINNDISLEGELRSILSPRTIDRILPKLPITSRIHLWKKELYFEIGIRMGSEKAVSTCNAGDIAYWPQGDAMCLFFETMTPFHKVNPLGQFANVDYGTVFKQIQSGMPVVLREKP
jgi:hypothetical protein